MSRAHAHKPHHPNNDVPDGFEPGAPPVEPAEGPVLPAIPDDPEHDRVINPDEIPSFLDQATRSPVGKAPVP